MLGIFLLMAAALAQTPSSAKLPAFEDYPVTETFAGTPHPPILADAAHRYFRTRIREGVSKGWGVKVDDAWGNEQHKPGPNFAGHYIIITWGCGTGCIRLAMTDAKTGHLYRLPVAEPSLAMPMLIFPNSAGRGADVESRKNSSLLIIRATPTGGVQPYAFYYRWHKNQWKLLRKVALRPDAIP